MELVMHSVPPVTCTTGGSCESGLRSSPVMNSRGTLLTRETDAAVIRGSPSCAPPRTHTRAQS
jgi:hypothetical protein